MRRFLVNHLHIKDELGLQLKENWRIVKFDSGNGTDLDFMGFRFFRNRTIMRKKILFKAVRKANKISKKEKPTIYDCKQMLSSLGWIKCTDVYGIYERLIKPKVNFQTLKRRISNYDRRISKCGKRLEAA